MITYPLGLDGDGEGLETRNLIFVVQDAIKFLRQQAEAEEAQLAERLFGSYWQISIRLVVGLRRKVPIVAVVQAVLFCETATVAALTEPVSQSLN